MLVLKEKELNDLEEDDIVYTKTSKRVMPSRASYYANTKQNTYIPQERDDYTVELIRGNRPLKLSNSLKQESLDIKNLETVNPETDLSEYENLRPELMPSSATMRVLKNNTYEETETETEEVVNFKINKKGLVMLMIYAIIIIAIFTAIIVNAVSLVNLTNQTSALEQQLALENTAIENLQSGIDKASDPQLLADRAKNELGMANGGIDGSVTLPVIASSVPETEYKKTTNIFDWILDHIFGGGF